VYVGLIDQLMESAAHTFVLNGCRQAGPYGAALCCTMKKNYIGKCSESEAWFGVDGEEFGTTGD